MVHISRTGFEIVSNVLAPGLTIFRQVPERILHALDVIDTALFSWVFTGLEHCERSCSTFIQGKTFAASA
jgi:hypothetical protein